MEIVAVLLGLVLLLALGGFSLLMNPPTAWINRMSGGKKKNKLGADDRT